MKPKCVSPGWLNLCQLFEAVINLGVSVIPFFFFFFNLFPEGFGQKESRFLLPLREGVEEGIRQGRKGKSTFFCFNSHPHPQRLCSCWISTEASVPLAGT